MRDKNKETARRMLLPRSNRSESPAEAFATVSAPSVDEYSPLRWRHPAPRCETPRICEMSRVVLGFRGTSYDYVATSSRTHSHSRHPDPAAERRNSLAQRVSAGYSRKLRPSPVGATLSGAALSTHLILVRASPSGSHLRPAVKIEEQWPYRSSAKSLRTWKNYPLSHA